MIEIEIKDGQVIQALKETQARLGDMSEVFEVIGELLEDTTEKRFVEGVSPDGVAWAPKSPATIAAYEKRGQTVNFKPLWGPGTESPALRSSFFRTVEKNSLAVGTNAIQAAVMQFGAKKGAFGKAKNDTPIPWGNIPARPFLGISETDRQLILETLDEWLDPEADIG